MVGRSLFGRITAGKTIIATLAVALFAAAPAAATLGSAKPGKGEKEAIFVGSNWEGTVEVFNPGGKYRQITKINMIPDLGERMAEMLTDPVRLGYFFAIRYAVGEGHDQFVDDMYSTHDGKYLIASRPSLRDVIAMDLDTREIAWRFVVDGQRADHMAISPDGKQVAVSASTGNVIHVLDTKTGEEIAKVPSGDSPHENVYSADGKRLYHASIGLVYTPADSPLLDSTKGERYFQVINTRNWEIVKRINMGKKLEKAGYPRMSAAVRPMAITKNERKVYFQVSFYHGFIEYDLRRDKVKRVVRLPVSNEVRGMPRENYLLDSAHHGIALNGNNKKLCVAGTMSDYAAIVNAKNAHYTIINAGKKPYWATTSSNGKKCFVSWSQSDKISVISYKKRKEIKSIPVGDHPQRIRMGIVRKAWVRAQQG